MPAEDGMARRLLELAAARGCLVERRPLFPYFHGLYLKDPGSAPRILLDEGLRGASLAYVLAHELGHHCIGSPGCWSPHPGGLRGSTAVTAWHERRASRFARLLLRLVARGMPAHGREAGPPEPDVEATAEDAATAGSLP